MVDTPDSPSEGTEAPHLYAEAWEGDLREKIESAETTIQLAHVATDILTREDLGLLKKFLDPLDEKLGELASSSLEDSDTTLLMSQTLKLITEPEEYCKAAYETGLSNMGTKELRVKLNGLSSSRKDGEFCTLAHSVLVYSPDKTNPVLVLEEAARRSQENRRPNQHTREGATINFLNEAHHFYLRAEVKESLKGEDLAGLMNAAWIGHERSLNDPELWRKMEQQLEPIEFGPEAESRTQAEKVGLGITKDIIRAHIPAEE